MSVSVDGSRTRQDEFVIVLFLMLVQALLLGMAWGADGSVPATLGIFVDFENTPSAASVEAMKTELKTFLAPAGIALAWRQLRRSKGDEGFDRAVIVKFKGVCRAGARLEESSRDMFARELTLAQIKVMDGRVLPFAEVECDNVKRGVERSPLKDRPVLFGHMLGKVLAHELYHLLRETVAHQRRGLTKAVLDWNELLGVGIELHTSSLTQ